MTTAQQEQAQEFGQALRQRLREVAAQGGDRAAFAEAAREGRQQFNAQLLAILTPEQRQRYEAALVTQRREAATAAVREGRVWVLGENGAPQPVTVRYGITDGSMTEIVGGDIDAGARVVAVPPTASRGLAGIRF